jgi:hypothetical protein
MSRAPRYASIAVASIALAVPTATALAAQVKLKASMNGTSEVPKGDTDGKGTATLTVDTAKRQICYDIKLTKVGSVSAGHIHKGAKGKAGAVVVPLFDKATKHPKGCVTKVKSTLIKDIASHPARYYVNVHNAAHPAGAVRGQLRK